MGWSEFGAVTLYVGTNHGEWGGNLVVEFENGKQIELLRENIVAIVPRKDRLHVFTGLAHLSISTGALSHQRAGHHSSEHINLHHPDVAAVSSAVKKTILSVPFLPLGRITPLSETDRQPQH